MRKYSPSILIALCIALFLTGCTKTNSSEAEIAQPPDLNGLWQAMGTAHWNLEGQNAFKGPATHLLGGLGGIPAGISYVEGGIIPYNPAALAQRNEYRDEWWQWDPAVKCYIPGIPRQTYMPFPFHVVQSGQKVFFAYEFGSNSRIVHLDRPATRAELPSWMGYSTGRWEGNTLVVEVTDQVPDTWFDAAGNHHSDQLKVTERYTLVNPNQITYEAVIEDAQTFTRPWRIKIPLYRRLEDNAQLLEYKCVPFAEDAVYGHLRQGRDRNKPTVKNLH